MNTQTTPRSEAELQSVHAARTAYIELSKADGHLSAVSNDARLARFVDAKMFNKIFDTTPQLQIIKA